MVTVRFQSVTDMIAAMTPPNQGGRPATREERMAAQHVIGYGRTPAGVTVVIGALTLSGPVDRKALVAAQAAEVAP